MFEATGDDLPEWKRRKGTIFPYSRIRYYRSKFGGINKSVPFSHALFRGKRKLWFAEKYPKAANASPGLLAEYSNRLQGHVQSVLSANGIGPDNYHDALIVNKEKSEQIRQQLAAQIQNDPKMVDMMLKLGKL